MWHGILYWLGGTNGSGPVYLLWSGAGSDIGELTLLFGAVAIYRKHTCHVKRCWRWSRHPVEGTGYLACRKHHPTVSNEAPTAEQLAQAHAEANQTNK